MRKHLLLLGLLCACTKPSDPPVTESPKQWVQEGVHKFSKDFAEKSGTCHYDGNLYTIQDSPDNAKKDPRNFLHVHSLDGTFKKSIQLVGVTNNDFEAVTCDEGKVYIGDIGDGASTKKIYLVVLSEVQGDAYAPKLVLSRKSDINFEGMIIKNNKFYLSSKDWGGPQTLYRFDESGFSPVFTFALPKKVGSIDLSDEAPITDMSLSPNKDKILITIDDTPVFCEMDWSGNGECFALESSGDHEGSTYINNNTFIFTSEDKAEFYTGVRK